MQTVVRRDHDGCGSVRDSVDRQRCGTTWRRHVEGRLQRVRPPPRPRVWPPCGNVAAMRRTSANTTRSSPSGAWSSGPACEGSLPCIVGGGEALGEVQLPSGVGGRTRRLPAASGAARRLPAGDERGARSRRRTARRTFLPMAIDRVHLVRPPVGTVWSHARVESTGRSDMLRGVGRPCHDAQGVVATLEGHHAARGTRHVNRTRRCTKSRGRGCRSTAPAGCRIRARCRPRSVTQFGALAASAGLDEYQRAFVELESLCTDWIVAALVDLGWHPVPGTSVSTDASGGPTPRRAALPPPARSLSRDPCRRWTAAARRLRLDRRPFAAATPVERRRARRAADAGELAARVAGSHRTVAALRRATR